MGSQELGMDSQGHMGIGSYRAVRCEGIREVWPAFLDALPHRCMWVLLVLEVVLLYNLGWIQI